MGERHRWVRLETHVRICRKCGMGKVSRGSGVNWSTTFYVPRTGARPWTDATPPCEEGDLSERWLRERLDPFLDLARGAGQERQPSTSDAIGDDVAPW